MIRVVMLGRLGNNLFQYAFGRALAEKHGVPLVMDASWFNHRTWPYAEPLTKIPGLDAKVVRPFSLGSRILKKVTRKHHWEYRGVAIIRENEIDHRFNPNLLNAPANCAVFGYFQTPLYFESVAAAIRQELCMADMGLEIGHEALAENLRHPASVAIHVRRTDYINNPVLISLGTSYYEAAMNRIRVHVPGAHFHIFSDDPAWCVANLKADDVTVCTHPDPFSPLTDLHLMNLASHHIIANSSYSWWAAWLGRKPEQQVIMPDGWFAQGINAPVSEKKLSHWTAISSG